jgi:hypothetical protein
MMTLVGSIDSCGRITSVVINYTREVRLFLADRGVDLADRGVDLADRGVDLADRGVDLADRGVDLADRGMNLGKRCVAPRMFLQEVRGTCEERSFRCQLLMVHHRQYDTTSSFQLVKMSPRSRSQSTAEHKDGDVMDGPGRTVGCSNALPRAKRTSRHLYFVGGSAEVLAQSKMLSTRFETNRLGHRFGIKNENK